MLTLITIELSGVEYGEIGLAEDPYFIPDENGYLRLTGTLSIDGNPDAHGFSLLMVRQQQE